ncbi:hypothetical protein [Agromyces sp. GXQ0307]|uniref:hypothetical protein n=1 Tax=Agromyces sp. GXQ0307 TaxID=3377835 RepID=UPI00383A9E01
MTPGEVAAASVAVFTALVTLIANWAVIRGDHASLRRLILLNDAIRDLPQDSPGRRGLTFARNELAVRTALRMYPPDGGTADVLRSLSRLLATVSIGVLLLLLAYAGLSRPQAGDVIVTTLTAIATTAAVAGYLLAATRLAVIRKKLSS